jgi:hypothetical protein
MSELALCHRVFALWQTDTQLPGAFRQNLRIIFYGFYLVAASDSGLAPPARGASRLLAGMGQLTVKPSTPANWVVP